MGIKNLLQITKEIQSSIHLKELSGVTIGIDAYVWLHRGAFSCAYELAQQKHSERLIQFCHHRLQLLLHFGVIPFFVFDGAPLPKKQLVEEERERRRKENREKGTLLWKAGKKSQAMEYFQKAIDITPEIAYQFIQFLKKEKIQFVVAPYEADAQLAYLAKTNVISAVLTEDSDLLAYGCERVLFKLDRYGQAVQVLKKDIQQIRNPNLSGWSEESFLELCILCGCDYLPSIPGIGIKTAHKHLNSLRHVDKMLKMLRLQGNVPVPSGYEDKFAEALYTFKHHWVYDPTERKMVPLNPFPSGIDPSTMPFLGSMLDDVTMVEIAEGRLNPILKTPFSISLKDSIPKTPKTNPKLLTSYFKKPPMTVPLLKRPLKDVNSKADILTPSSKRCISRFFLPNTNSANSSSATKVSVLVTSNLEEEKENITSNKSMEESTLLQEKEETLPSLKHEEITISESMIPCLPCETLTTPALAVKKQKSLLDFMTFNSPSAGPSSQKRQPSGSIFRKSISMVDDMKHVPQYSLTSLPRSKSSRLP